MPRAWAATLGRDFNFDESGDGSISGGLGIDHRVVAEDRAVRFQSGDAGGDGGLIQAEQVGELAVGEASFAAEKLEKRVGGHGRKRVESLKV